MSKIRGAESIGGDGDGGGGRGGNCGGPSGVDLTGQQGDPAAQTTTQV